MFFHLSALTVVAALAFGKSTSVSSLISVLLYNRHRVLPIIAPYLPSALVARLSHYTPLSTFSFSDQVAAGMSSSSFDVESANLGEGSSEARLGLDEAGVEEVRRIMAVERCGFDQARLIRHNRHLAKNGIAPDGEYLYMGFC